jgi:hypothetical protein
MVTWLHVCFAKKQNASASLQVTSLSLLPKVLSRLPLMADKVRKEPLRCILNGLGKDAAKSFQRINGFTYVQTQFDYYTGRTEVVREIKLF